MSITKKKKTCWACLKNIVHKTLEIKIKNEGVILSDSKPVGDKNQLTDVVIDQPTVYYGYSVRGNNNDLINMRMTTWVMEP